VVTVSFLNGLPQDQTRGALQVLNKQGLWMEANPIPGALTMNIGDMYATISSCWHDRFVATL
jgi:isopenicillin N synthase-like dioxygenase